MSTVTKTELKATLKALMSKFTFAPKIEGTKFWVSTSENDMMIEAKVQLSKAGKIYLVTNNQQMVAISLASSFDSIQENEDLETDAIVAVRVAVQEVNPDLSEADIVSTIAWVSNQPGSNPAQVEQNIRQAKERGDNRLVLLELIED